MDVWTWITKALLLRSHALAPVFSERLFTLFGDPSQDVAWAAARALGRVPSQDDVLSKANGAVSKVLYAQKYVGRILPKAIEGAKDGRDPPKQVAYLVALSSLIKSAPKATYVAELPALIPLLIRGLDLPDASIRYNVIETFLAAAESAGGDTSAERVLVNEHAATLVYAMLRNCSAAHMPVPKVRTLALRYLGKLPGIVRADTLNRYKAEVVAELGKALDDPRRAVRREAVDARTHWFKYSG